MATKLHKYNKGRFLRLSFGFEILERGGFKVSVLAYLSFRVIVMKFIGFLLVGWILGGMRIGGMKEECG